jgi:hypothetical protein
MASYVLVQSHGANSFGIPTGWPRKIKKITADLPPSASGDFDTVLLQADYDSYVTANAAAYQAGKAAMQAQAQLQAGAAKFAAVRAKWQNIADRYATENSAGGITTATAASIADAFANVEKYLRLNVPTKALSEIDNISPIEPYLPQSKINSMKAELLAFIQETFNL